MLLSFENPKTINHAIFSYTIDDLKGEKQFLVTMEISVCFEANGPCALTIPILEEVRLPKPLCNLDSGFSLSGTYLYCLCYNILVVTKQH